MMKRFSQVVEAGEDGGVVPVVAVLAGRCDQLQDGVVVAAVRLLHEVAAAEVASVTGTKHKSHY